MCANLPALKHAPFSYFCCVGGSCGRKKSPSGSMTCSTCCRTTSPRYDGFAAAEGKNFFFWTAASPWTTLAPLHVYSCPQHNRDSVLFLLCCSSACHSYSRIGSVSLLLCLLQRYDDGNYYDNFGGRGRGRRRDRDRVESVWPRLPLSFLLYGFSFHTVAVADYLGFSRSAAQRTHNERAVALGPVSYTHLRAHET